jgi:Flp pilus assembly protein CpaB
MSSVAPHRRSGGISPVLFGAVLFVCLGGIAYLLWQNGTISLPFLHAVRAVANDDPSQHGMVAVPISARVIPAYTKVSRDDLWDAANTRLSVTWLPPDQLAPGMLREPKDVLGRVLDHEKPAGYIFTEGDFLPRGTRPGVVGGIPPGKRAVRIEASVVPGLFGLAPGDRFDLISTLAIDTKTQDLSHINVAGNYGPQIAMQASLANALKRATVKVIVQNGVVVTPVTTRQVPFTVNSLTQGTLLRSRPVQEILVAVDPKEVAPLTEAIAVKAEIMCVPRSGRPDDPGDSVTPELPPNTGLGMLPGNGNSSKLFPDLTLIETVNGTKREMTAVPVSKQP